MLVLLFLLFEIGFSATCGSASQCSSSCFDECGALRKEVFNLTRNNLVLKSERESLENDIRNLTSVFKSFRNDLSNRKAQYDELKNETAKLESEYRNLQSILKCNSSALCDRVPKILKLHESKPTQTGVNAVKVAIPGGVSGIMFIKCTTLQVWSSSLVWNKGTKIYSTATAHSFKYTPKSTTSCFESISCAFNSTGPDPRFGMNFHDCTVTFKIQTNDIKITFLDMDF